MTNKPIITVKGFCKDWTCKDVQYKIGETLTVLNPAGLAEFDGMRMNVVSEGSYLEKGVRVRVQQVEGNKIIVRKA